MHPFIEFTLGGILATGFMAIIFAWAFWLVWMLEKIVIDIRELVRPWRTR